jgi:hypothetical protein
MFHYSHLITMTDDICLYLIVHFRTISRCIVHRYIGRQPTGGLTFGLLRWFNNTARSQILMIASTTVLQRVFNATWKVATCFSCPVMNFDEKCLLEPQVFILRLFLTYILISIDCLQDAQ